MISNKIKLVKNILVNKILLAIMFAATSSISYAQNFLPDAAAFKVAATMKDANTVQVKWTIEPGYKMYKKSLSFVSQGKILLGNPVIPKGKVEYNTALGETIEQFDTSINITVPVTGNGNFKLIAKGQGCAEAGLCYPPFERIIDIKRAR